MGKLKRRAAETTSAEAPAKRERPAPNFEPLPPPRRNKALLIVAVGLLAAWIAFLVLLVLWR